MAMSNTAVAATPVLLARADQPSALASASKAQATKAALPKTRAAGQMSRAAKASRAATPKAAMVQRAVVTFGAVNKPRATAPRVGRN